MDKLILEIPPDLAEAIRLPLEERVGRLRRELAGMSKWEFHFLIGEEGIPRRYDLDELRRDLKTLEILD